MYNNFYENTRNKFCMVFISFILKRNSTQIFFVFPASFNLEKYNIIYISLNVCFNQRFHTHTYIWTWNSNLSEILTCTTSHTYNTDLRIRSLNFNYIVIHKCMYIYIFASIFCEFGNTYIHHYNILLYIRAINASIII